MLKKIKNPLLFTAATIPIAFLGGLFAVMSTFPTYELTMQQEMLASAGSYGTLLFLGALQAVPITVICGFLGYIFADKIGLMRPFRFQKESLLRAAVPIVICGVLFSLDYWVFGSILPQIAEIYESQHLTTAPSFLAGILYGGVVEEVLMRLFLMSLFVFTLWKVFARKCDVEQIPQSIFIAANILAAALFAAGHLPANAGIFGTLTPTVIFRCFLLNGGPGVLFGWLYYKHGIQYAMLAHAGTHIISKIIWLVFV